MTVWILLAVFIVLFLFAINPLSWGAWAKRGWRDLHDADIEDTPSDIEVRAFYRKLAFENVPTLSPNAILKFHDQTLDRLIAEGKYDEANDFRMLQVKESRRRGDRDALNTYILYKRIIVTMRADDDEAFRKSLRNKFGVIKDGSSVEEVQKRRGAVAPMRLIEREEDFVDEPLQYDNADAMHVDGHEEIREKEKTEYLEMGETGPAFNRPPLTEEARNFDPESINQDDYIDFDDEEEEEEDYKEAIKRRAEKFAKKKGLKMREEGEEAVEEKVELFEYQKELPDEVVEEEIDIWVHNPEKEEDSKFEYETQKLRTKDDYRKTDKYKADLSLVRDKKLKYDEEEALETASTSSETGPVESYDVDDDNIWGKAPSEPVEIPTVEKKEDEPAVSETDDDDDYTQLIDI